MTINWKKGPGFVSIDKIILPKFNELTLDNNIRTILVNEGSQDVFKLDLVFKGGRWLENKQLTSKFTAILMREGTISFNSQQIAELIDFYGANLRVGANLDYIYFSLSGLSKHLHSLLPLLSEIIFNPSFEESEVAKSQSNNIQKLQHDLAKNEVVNYRVFTEVLFGKDHPYGYNTTEDAINNLKREDLIAYHKAAICTDNCTILCGGRFNENIIDLLNQNFGQISLKADKYNVLDVEKIALPQKLFIESKNEHQASIKIGRRTINRHHQDYTGFFMLNTVLGGYFGSRLMSSVREEKGLTYNIFSSYDLLVHDGYFYVETEIALDKVDETITEVFHQFSLLKENLIEEDELTMVKNYLMGNFLNLIDGPLNTISFLRGMVIDGTNEKDFYTFVEDIKNIDSNRLKTLANKYFQEEDFLTVIVAKP